MHVSLLAATSLTILVPQSKTANTDLHSSSINHIYCLHHQIQTYIDHLSIISTAYNITKYRLTLIIHQSYLLLTTSPNTDLHWSSINHIYCLHHQIQTYIDHSSIISTAYITKYRLTLIIYQSYLMLTTPNTDLHWSSINHIYCLQHHQIQTYIDHLSIISTAYNITKYRLTLIIHQSYLLLTTSPNTDLHWSFINHIYCLQHHQIQTYIDHSSIISTAYITKYRLIFIIHQSYLLLTTSPNTDLHWSSINHIYCLQHHQIQTYIDHPSIISTAYNITKYRLTLIIHQSYLLLTTSPNTDLHSSSINHIYCLQHHQIQTYIDHLSIISTAYNITKYRLTFIIYQSYLLLTTSPNTDLHWSSINHIYCLQQHQIQTYIDHSSIISTAYNITKYRLTLIIHQSYLLLTTSPNTDLYSSSINHIYCLQHHQIQTYIHHPSIISTAYNITKYRLIFIIHQSYLLLTTSPNTDLHSSSINHIYCLHQHQIQTYIDHLSIISTAYNITKYRLTLIIHQSYLLLTTSPNTDLHSSSINHIYCLQHHQIQTYIDHLSIISTAYITKYRLTLIIHQSYLLLTSPNTDLHWSSINHIYCLHHQIQTYIDHPSTISTAYNITKYRLTFIIHQSYLLLTTSPNTDLHSSSINHIYCLQHHQIQTYIHHPSIISTAYITKYRLTLIIHQSYLLLTTSPNTDLHSSSINHIYCLHHQIQTYIHHPSIISTAYNITKYRLTLIIHQSYLLLTTSPNTDLHWSSINHIYCLQHHQIQTYIHHPSIISTAYNITKYRLTLIIYQSYLLLTTPPNTDLHWSFINHIYCLQHHQIQTYIDHSSIISTAYNITKYRLTLIIHQSYLLLTTPPNTDLHWSSSIISTAYNTTKYRLTLIIHQSYLLLTTSPNTDLHWSSINHIYCLQHHQIQTYIHHSSIISTAYNITKYRLTLIIHQSYLLLTTSPNTDLHSSSINHIYCLQHHQIQTYIHHLSIISTAYNITKYRLTLIIYQSYLLLTTSPNTDLHSSSINHIYCLQHHQIQTYIHHLSIISTAYITKYRLTLIIHQSYLLLTTPNTDLHWSFINHIYCLQHHQIQTYIDHTSIISTAYNITKYRLTLIIHQSYLLLTTSPNTDLHSSSINHIYCLQHHQIQTYIHHLSIISTAYNITKYRLTLIIYQSYLLLTTSPNTDLHWSSINHIYCLQHHQIQTYIHHPSIISTAYNITKYRLTLIIHQSYLLLTSPNTDLHSSSINHIYCLHHQIQTYIDHLSIISTAYITKYRLTLIIHQSYLLLTSPNTDLHWSFINHIYCLQHQIQTYIDHLSIISTAYNITKYRLTFIIHQSYLLLTTPNTDLHSSSINHIYCLQHHQHEISEQSLFGPIYIYFNSNSNK